MSQTLNAAIAVVGIDIGKNSFLIVGQDERGAIVLRQKWSRRNDNSEECLGPAGRCPCGELCAPHTPATHRGSI